MLALEGSDTLLIVDCGGDAAQRVLAQDLKLASVTGLIVTHEHADHVGGFALLMERLWLAGHRTDFHVYGIRSAVDQAQRVHDVFDTSTWPQYPRVVYHEVERSQGAPVVSTPDFEVTAVVGRHSVPAIGLRVVDRHGGGVLVYSCDTERSEAVVEAARGADVLIHEASGRFPGHSTGGDAGDVAARAGVGQLVLVHVPPQPDCGAALLAEARERFVATELGRDGDTYEF